MTKLPVFSPKGVKLTPVTVADELFAAKVNQNLMTQAVRVYRSNQRQAPALAKRRGAVLVTKAKVWRQKGTGRARHGSRNAPIFVGGGQAHGPTGTQNFNLKLSKAMKQKSLFSALTFQFKAGLVMAVDKLSELPEKTSKFDASFKALTKAPKSILLLIDPAEKSLIKPTRNLAYVTTMPAVNLNTYQALAAKNLIFTKPALKALEKHYGFA